MEKIDIEKEHIITREGLHDLMMKYNKKAEKQIEAEKLSEAIYNYIDCKYDANSTENDLKLNLEINMYLQYHFRNMLIFKYKEYNYIYWIENKNKSDEFNYVSKKEFIECLLDNYYELDSNDLIEILNQTKEDLNFIRKSEKYRITSIKESYKNYDYIKAIYYNNNINYWDVTRCKEYLKLSNNKQNDFNLRIDEKVCLCLIILYGLKNIYFYSSELYKKSIKDYYNDINNINDWINYIEENKDNITKERIYSKEYECHINLKQIIKQFSVIQEINSSHIIRKYLQSNYLKETLQLIYFEYLIKNNFSENANKNGDLKHEEGVKKARKYLEDNPIYLYSFLDKTLLKKTSKDEKVKYLTNEIVNDYKIKKHDTIECDANINDVLRDHLYKNEYLIPTLKFIIDYLYLLRAEKKTKPVDTLYSLLQLFRKGVEIEELFVKYDYESMLSKLTDLKTSDDNNMDVDRIIDKIADKIDKANLIDEHDIEKVGKIYPYINFKNLDSKVQKYIATGDTIMLVFDDSNNIGFDYSSAVIEWCKAVELESYNKLTKEIRKYKNEIQNELIGEKFIFGNTIGFFHAMKGRKMKDGREMRKYLYDKYFSKIYDFDEEVYNELMNNIESIHQPRNDSAHKYKSIDWKSAKECQSIILSAKKILEVLSNLKKDDNRKNKYRYY